MSNMHEVPELHDVLIITKISESIPIISTILSVHQFWKQIR